jgi:hypothetical protein
MKETALSNHVLPWIKGIPHRLADEHQQAEH